MTLGKAETDQGSSNALGARVIPVPRRCTSGAPSPLACPCTMPAQVFSSARGRYSCSSAAAWWRPGPIRAIRYRPGAQGPDDVAH